MCRFNSIPGYFLAVVCTWAGQVQADMIADWTFETSQPATAGPFAPEIGLGSASGLHAGAATYSKRLAAFLQLQHLSRRRLLPVSDQFAWLYGYRRLV